MENNELKDRLENEIMYKVYKANVPKAVYDEQFEVVNDFCKQNFMDNRWTMIWTLVNGQLDDYKFAMLYDKLEELSTEIELLKQQNSKPVIDRKEFKTFGRND